MIAFLAARFLALPPWAIKAIELLVLLAALAGALAYAHHHIYQQGYDAAVAARKSEDNAALAAATQKAAADQRELSNKFLLAQRDRFKENQDAKVAIDDLRRRMRAGAAVLRLPAGSAICGIPAPGGAAAGAGSGVEVGSFQLMPGTADAFVSVGGRIAAGVRRENDLIDAYERCRAAANAK
jgi:hypothetical protein